MQVDLLADPGAQGPGVRRHPGRASEVRSAELVSQPLGQPEPEMDPATARVVPGDNLPEQDPRTCRGERHPSGRGDERDPPGEDPPPRDRRQVGQAQGRAGQVAARRDPGQPAKPGEQAQRDREHDLPDLRLRRGGPHVAVRAHRRRAHLVERGRQGADGRVLVEVRHRDLREACAQPGHHLRRGQAPSAEVEEVVAFVGDDRTHHIEPQLGDPGRRTFQIGGAPGVGLRVGERPGERVAVDLPRGPGRQGGYLGEAWHERCGHHLSEVLHRCACVEPVLDGDVADEDLVACPALPYGGRGADDPGQCEQRVVDLAQLDASTTELDLVIAPAGEEEPLLVVHDLVAAAVGALPTQGGERRVLLRVLLGVQVTRQPDAADDQLTDLARAARERRPRRPPPGPSRPVAGRSAPARLGELCAARDHGRLGRAIGVPQLAPGPRQPGADLRRAGLPAHDQQAYGVQ